MLTIRSVDSPQHVDALLPGAGTNNRLFVFTGTAVLDWRAPDDDQLRSEQAELDISSLHGNVLFHPQSDFALVSAWPASIHATSDADEVTWAVDKSSGEIAPDGRLLAKFSLALQGASGAFSRLAYEVLVQALSVRVLGVSVYPSVVRLEGQPVTFYVSILLDQAVAPPGAKVWLSHDKLDITLPSEVMVTGNSIMTTGTVGLAFPKGSQMITVTAGNDISRASASFTVIA